MGKYEFNVKMSCGGCSGAVEKALEKAKAPEPDGLGITSYQVSLDTQLVTVEASSPYDDVLAKIQKTGKQVVSGRVVSD